MPKTGNKTTAGGIYRSKCCRYESTLGVGNKCPPCAKCLGGTTWTLVRASNRPKAAKKATSKSKGLLESLFGW